MTNPSPIHVCFIAPKAYLLFNPEYKGIFGGAEVDLYLLSRELAKDDLFKISFVTADYGQPDNETIHNVHLHKSITFLENPVFGAYKIWKSLKKANADIYVQETFSPGTILVSLFCRVHSKAFVYRTAHSDECDGTNLSMFPIMGRFFLLALRNASSIITQNNCDRIALEKTAKLSSCIIANSIYLPVLTSGPKHHILWVGRSADFKRPHRFFELVQSFPNETFMMICPQASNDKNYESLCSKAKSFKNLTFYSHIDYHQIMPYYQQAKIYINTSDSEGFPNTFVQAGAAGTAILSFAVNPDDFLTRYNCGLCCRGDMDKLKAGLAFLLDGQRYIEIGKNGRKYVEENHDISRIVKQYKAVFMRLVEQKRRTR
jgi:glycosyltransferase involved in cell wall biosynthesis